MKAFFDSIRRDFGSLKQSQVEGFELLYNATKDLPVRHQAYILSTVWHETAATMKPIAEYGKGKGHSYGQSAGPYGQIYYGRGYVQLTWHANYVKAGQKIGHDLERYPDHAMHTDIAAKVLIKGMLEGWFTGKKLSDYTTYAEMRRVVNGRDKAYLIGDYAEKIEKAIMAQAQADIAKPVIPPPPDIEPHREHLPDAPKVDVTTSHNIAAIVLGALGALIAAVAAFIGFGR